ncbi:transmembrane protein, putative [Bodo saltans]|uniref:Transmembrane protein, putative n=1 Tax=Bodo saltans TaxID=75058 RepID=A0A0S4IQB0_BODSA|nr:transmembrane protein, putative [Bodo saltans]|eukprot:CUE71365.1 transmembrane protein, putative [Bodo saltans]
MGSNVVYVTGSASNMMLSITGTVTLATLSVFAVRNNKGYFPTTPPSNRQPFITIVNQVTLTSTKDGAGFLVGGNVWNASLNGAAVAKLIVATSGLTYTSTRLNSVKFGCNTVSGSVISDYTNGVSVPSSFYTALPVGASPVVACGACSVYLDCYSANTRSAYLAADGSCACICYQRPTSSSSALPCSPPVLAFTSSKSVAVTISKNSSTSSMTRDLTSSQTPTISTSTSTTFSNSLSYTVSSTSSASHTNTRTASRTASVSLSESMSLTYSASPSASISRDATASNTPTPQRSASESPTPSPTDDISITTSPTTTLTETKSLVNTSTPSTSTTFSGTTSDSPVGSTSRTWSRTPSLSSSISKEPLQTPSATLSFSSNRTITPGPSRTIQSNSSSASFTASMGTPSGTNSTAVTASHGRSLTKRHNHTASLSSSFPTSLSTSPTRDASSTMPTSTFTLSVTDTTSTTITKRSSTHSESQTRSYNPCSMPWATNVSAVITNITAPDGLRMLALAGVAGFSWAGAVPYEFMFASGVAFNLTLNRTFALKRTFTDATAIVWASSVQASPVSVRAVSSNVVQITLGSVTYNKFLAKQTTITIFGSSFVCAPKLKDMILSISVTPQPITISAATVQALTSVASSLSVATANPTAGVAAARVSMLRNLLECTVDLTDDNGNSFTGYYFGPRSGQYSRGAVVGNIIFFVAVGGIGAVIAACVALYGKIRHHKRWRDGFVLVMDILHYPSVLMIPLAVILQPTLTESVTLIVVQPAIGDWVIGVCGLVCMAMVVLPFTYVLLFDFRCVIALRTEEDKAKRNKKLQSSITWMVGEEKDEDATYLNHLPGLAEEGAASPTTKKPKQESKVRKFVRVVFEEEHHWVVADHSRTDHKWKRRFLFLFGDYKLRWYCLLDLWISILLGGIAGINLGVRNVCLFQLISIVLSYTMMFLSCVVFRPAFGRFATYYVLIVNAFGLVGGASTLVASWNSNATAINISSISALLISGVSMIKTFPDLFLLVLALPSIVMSVLHPFRDAGQMHSFLKGEELKANAEQAALMERARIANLKDEEMRDVSSRWSPRDLDANEGGEDMDSSAGRHRRFTLLLREGERAPHEDAAPAKPTHHPSNSTYVFHRRMILDLLDTPLFDCRAIVQEMVTNAMPLCAKDMRMIARSIVEDAMTGGPARLAASHAIHYSLIPRLMHTIDMRAIVMHIVKQAIVASERANIGAQGIDDLIGSVHQANVPVCRKYCRRL